MKAALLALFFLVFAFTSAKASILVDTEGNAVRNGGSYYILPARRGNGGGLSLAAIGGESCPLTVVQTLSEQSNGLPTRLSSPYKILYLPTNFDLDFTVVAPPKCAAQPAKWTIVGRKEENRQVKLAGQQDTVRGSFRIQTHRGLTYKIVFCESGEESCRALGLSNDDKGHRILSINDENPFVVVFRKAQSSAA
ncbi:trypsin inhibitor DE5 alpha chain-like [Neltuma alba]|uniref:trypsin inhibitor DE5 alpha chain-like n=1 Tax=Neltuma alba TaxID=207710 RepID=UPI0010A58F7B|nr:trypsin inhibitor DE5 alpha chain-like [Prosopis alba]XP_028791512.1 trypsin inhibitor DE5 alpha chain-like [Prosopis alba]